MRTIKSFLWLLLALVTSTPLHADDLSVTWPFDKGAENVTSGTPSIAGAVSYSNIRLGSSLAYIDARKTGDVTLSLIQPKVKASDNKEENTVTISLKLKKGLRFTPQQLSFNASRYGTNGGALDIIASSGSKNATIATAFRPARNDAYDKCSYSLSAIGETSEELNIKIYIKSLDTNKQVGFGNIVITGSVSGTAEAVPSYTLTTKVSDTKAGTVVADPAAETLDEDTPVTLTATENFGYHFDHWADATGASVSKKNPYSFNISANTDLTAVYTAKNVYALNLSMTNGALDNSVTVTPTGHMVNGTHYYEDGTDVKLTTHNNKILTFTHWEDNSTSPERTIRMDSEKNVVANFSACDYIVAWDLHDTSIGQDRAADYASESENAGLLQLRNAEGVSKGWLSSMMRDKWSARVWKNLSEKNYFEISFSTKGYYNIKVAATVGDDFNGHSIVNMQASKNGTDFKTIGTYNLPNRGWDEQEFSLPSEFEGQDKVQVRFMPDFDSPLTGVTSDLDGTAVAEIFVTADKETLNDTEAPRLVSSIPAADEKGVSSTGSIILVFNERITATTGTATLDGENITPVISGKTAVFAYSGLKYNTAYTFTLPAGLITDRSGNAFEGLTLHFTTMERKQPEPRLYDAVVAQDGTGDYKTVQEAIDAAPAGRTQPWLIFIKKGVYTGHHDIPESKPYLHFIGQGRNLVSISDNRCSGGDNAYPVSTGATLTANSDNLYFEGINFVNSWGVEKNGGPQALALFTVGDRIVLNKVGMLSYQDTWLTTTKLNRRHYIKDSFIEGAVDFIYGQGNVFFDHDTLNIVRKSGGWIVAPNHGTGTTWGYVFMNTLITAPGKPSDTSILLGRPWHDYPITVFINTRAEVKIPAAGWADHMGGLPKLWAEYNTMDGNGNPVDLSHRITDYWIEDANKNKVWGKSEKAVLTAEEAAQYTVKNVLSGNDAWQPTLLTEACDAPKVNQEGRQLSWQAVPYAICYVVTVDGNVVGFTTDTEYSIPSSVALTPTSKCSVQAANEYGGLSDASIATPTAISSVEADKAKHDTWYTLNGQRTNRLQNGIYVSTGKKVIKR